MAQTPNFLWTKPSDGDSDANGKPWGIHIRKFMTDVDTLLKAGQDSISDTNDVIGLVNGDMTLVKADIVANNLEIAHYKLEVAADLSSINADLANTISNITTFEAETAITIAGVNDLIDGVSADAASAAAAAALVATGLTDANARITTAFGNITTTGSRIDTLTNTVTTNASTSATDMSAIRSRMGLAESGIISLNSTVATNAGTSATAISGLTSSLGAVTSDLATFHTTVVNQNEANATALTTLTTNLGSTSSTLTSFQNSVANAHYASTTNLTDLHAAITSETNVAISAGISNFQTTIANPLYAKSSDLTTLTSSVNDVTKTNGTIDSKIAAFKTTIADPLYATSTVVTNLSSSMGDITKTGGTIDAKITSFKTTYVDATFAKSTDVNILHSTITTETNTAVASGISNFKTTVADPLYAKSSDLSTLHSTITGETSGAVDAKLVTWKSTVADPLYAKSSDLTILHSSITTETNTAITAGITSFKTTVADPLYAKSTDLTTLTSSVNDITKASGTIDAKLSSYKITVTDPLYAKASDVTTLSSSIGGSIDAKIGTFKTTYVDATFAKSTDLNTLSSSIGGTVDSKLTTWKTTVADPLYAKSADLTSLHSTINSETTASLDSFKTTITDPLYARATDFSTLSTTVGTHTSSISSISTSVGGLQAKWGIAINNNGVISGISLNSGLDTKTTFSILADKFVVVDASNASHNLMTVSGNTITLNAEFINLNGIVTFTTTQTNATNALANAATAINNAAAAQTTANNAATAAATATTAVADISSDDSFSALEKSAIRREWESIASNKTANDTQATAFAITTEKTTYGTSFQALANYLNGGATWSTGIPLWINDANLAVSTVIVGATFRTKFKDYYDAETALLNAIATKAKTLANAAQGTADTGVANAATAQLAANAASTAATNAQTAATAANTAATAAQTSAALAVTNAATATTAIADISSDNQFTAVEKSSTRQDWDAIASEKTVNDAQATTFGITTEKTAYGIAFQALATYLNAGTAWTTGVPSWISDANLAITTAITGSTFRSTFKSYYDARTTLLNAIAAKAKTLADTAQTQANTATTNAATAQTQADLGVTNAALAQTQATTAIANAATAQTAATNAASAATNAQTSATTANNLLTDIASDNKLTASEKSDARKEWNIIASELSTNDSQATVFGITTEKTTYDNAFQALATYLNAGTTWTTGIPSWISDANLGTTTDIVGGTFRTTWKTYYDSRTALINAIAAKAKTLADAAQTQAQTATTNAASAQGTANTASNNATSALNSLLDIASDNKFTAVEKTQVRQEWNVVASERTTNDLQATAFSITTEKTSYDNAFQALATYLNNGTAWTTGVPSWIADANLGTTTDIVGATFRTTFQTYYDAKTVLLNAVSTKAKLLADAAQTQATTATNNAATAQSKADTAFANAGTANTTLADIADDNKLTPVEKSSVKQEWDAILSEKTANDAQADTFAITTEKTSYGTTFQSLATYLNNAVAWSTGTPTWISDLTTTTTIVGSTFRTKFKDYYDARTALLNAIANKARTLANAAQDTATTANTNAGNAQNTANAAAATASAAQIAADNAVITAGNAQTNANTAISNAATANSAIADISSDDKFTAVEKSSVRQEWDMIAAEKTVNDTQATTFGVTTEKTTYGTTFQALATYLNNGTTWSTGIPTWITDVNLSVTTTIVGSTFRSTFKAYYDARTALLNAIATKAKTLADAAQTTATTANTNAGNAQGTATTALNNAATAKAAADTAATAAATAQGKADTAFANAGTAQTTANNAATSAATANSSISDMSSDGKFTGVEKSAARQEWDIVSAEKTVNDSQATTFSITTEKTTYGTAFQALATYLNAGTTWSTGVPYWINDANLTSTTDIVGTTFRSAWKAYYDARTALLNAISVKAKTLADAAQTQATTATNNASTAANAAAVAKAAADAAQTTATNAGAAAGAAQTLATNASTAANTANTLLTDIASDDKFTSSEKAATRKEWNVVAAEVAGNDTQASTFSISTTTYDTAFQALATYLNNGVVWSSEIPSWISDANISVTTDIVGSTFRTIWKNYYDARTALLNAVTVKAKALADTAQTAAIAAQGTANTGVTNAATAQGTANSAVTNAATAQARAETAVTNAATAQAAAIAAQGSATAAANSASTAQTRADNAFANAGTANTAISDIADDNKFTPVEKSSTKMEWDSILSEKSINNAQADAFNITTEKSTYGTAFQALASYLNAGTTWSTGTPSWLANLSTTADIVGSTFRSKFKDYYDARTGLLNAIAAKAKALADTAQIQANTATTNAATAATAAATAQTQANAGVTNAATAQTAATNAAASATTAIANAATAQTAATNAASAASAAQTTANTAVTNAATATTNAATAQTRADNAFANAGTANTAISDISNDNKFTPVEKSSSKMEWDTIVSEKATNDSQATAFGITTEKTTYGTNFQALANYLNAGSAWSTGTPSWLASLGTTTDIDGPTFRTNFKNYYDSRTALLNAISAKAKALADAAQTQANTANTAAGTANTAATNAASAASAAQTQANTATTNAATAQAAAVAAQGTANTGVTNAAAALLAANNNFNTATLNINAVKTAIYYPGTTQIHGASIRTGTIVADAISTSLLQTNNYTQNSSGYPLTGAKLDAWGPALKVAANNLLVGGYTFGDAFFRSLNALDGSSASGKVFYRGSSNANVRAGTPNINCLSISARICSTTIAAFSVCFDLILQPTSTDDNLDGMRYAKIQVYPHGTNGVADTLYVALPDRCYVNNTESNALNSSRISFNWTYASGGTFGIYYYTTSTHQEITGYEYDGNGLSYPVYSPVPDYNGSFYGHLLVSIVNVYGKSAEAWYHGTTSVGVLTRDFYNPYGPTPDPTPTGGGGTTGGATGGGVSVGGGGGYCPAPYTLIDTIAGPIAAEDVTVGMKVKTFNAVTCFTGEYEITSVVPGVSDVWTLELEDGRILDFAADHRFLTFPLGFVELQLLTPGTHIRGTKPGVVKSVILKEVAAPVIQISVDQAFTYEASGLISHNMKAMILDIT